MVEGDGFEPSKAEPADLQSDPFGHSGTPPALSCAALVSVRKRVPFYGRPPTLASVFLKFLKVFCDLFHKMAYISALIWLTTFSGLNPQLTKSTPIHALPTRLKRPVPSEPSPDFSTGPSFGRAQALG